MGIVGGEPKCCKSFLALDMAVAVASGTACLRRYAVARPGRVLLFAAEDALHIVRARLDGICRAAGVKLADIDIQVITAPSVRLDLEVDRKSLAETVAALQPRLLILDPFVRLHRIDENISGEVAPLLAYLRELQRRHQLAVVVVHHAKKGAGKARAGQALRGSSEFHAWGDSNLYLRRTGEQLTLAVEQRAAASSTGISLQLQSEGEALALEVSKPPGTPAPASPAALPVAERVVRALSRRDQPALDRRAPQDVPDPNGDSVRGARGAHRPGPRPQDRHRLRERHRVAFPDPRFPPSLQRAGSGNGKPIK